MKKFFKHTIGNVRIVEVGLRDGLQNETHIVPLNVKIELLNTENECEQQVVQLASKPEGL